ncbi:MAG TPA: hypothetical protein VNT26_09205, partial [Candidatus Sulfotelmatobacter sp.]|nr:hypothetical protein [Candidatus Sulfotelmatobacter sp.]
MRECLFLFLLVLCGCGGPTQSEGFLPRLRSKSLPVRLQAIAQAGIHPNAQVQAELLRIFQDERDVPIARG